MKHSRGFRSAGYRKRRADLDERLVEYIVTRVVPPDKSEACKMRIKLVMYHMFGGNLYKWSFYGPLLRHLRPKNVFKGDGTYSRRFLQ